MIDPTLPLNLQIAQQAELDRLDAVREDLEAWLWQWYDRTSGPGEDWTIGELRDALLEEWTVTRRAVQVDGSAQ